MVSSFTVVICLGVKTLKHDGFTLLSKKKQEWNMANLSK
jgi:hypothetical protein